MPVAAAQWWLDNDEVRLLLTDPASLERKLRASGAPQRPCLRRLDLERREAPLGALPRRVKICYEPLLRWGAQQGELEMTDDRGSMAGNPKSTATIGGHPIHPMLVPFPIACLVGAFVTDLLFLHYGSAGFANASKWLLAFGILTALLAAGVGLIDFMGDDRIRRLGHALQHMIANVSAVVVAVINLVVRLGDETAERRFARRLSVRRDGADPAVQRLARRRSRLSCTRSASTTARRPRSSPSAALSSSARSTFSHGNRSPSALRPKWP